MLESLRIATSAHSIAAFESGREIAGRFWWFAYRTLGGW